MFGAVLGNHFPRKLPKVMEGFLKIDVSEFASGCSRMLPEVVAARAPQDLPSTRAGGQDYVS